MTYSAQTGQLGLAIQSAKGVFATPDWFAPYKNIGIPSDADLLMPEPEIAGSRSNRTAYQSARGYAGDVSLYLQPEIIGLYLYGVLGSVSSSLVGGSTLTYDHVFTTANTLPWMSVEEVISDPAFAVHRITDCVFNSLGLEFAANAYATANANIMGLSQTDANSASVAGYDTDPYLPTHKLVTVIDGVTCYCKNITVNINNNSEGSNFATGKIESKSINPKRRDTIVSVELEPESKTEYNNLYKLGQYGSKSADTPQGTLDYVASTFTITSYEETEAGFNWSLALSVPNGVIKPFSISASGDETITFGFDILAMEVGGVSEITATLRNKEASYLYGS